MKKFIFIVVLFLSSYLLIGCNFLIDDDCKNFYTNEERDSFAQNYFDLNESRKSTEDEITRVMIPETSYNDSLIKKIVIKSEEELNGFIAKIQGQEIPLSYENEFLEQLQIPINFEKQWLVIHNFLESSELGVSPAEPLISGNKVYIRISTSCYDGNAVTLSSKTINYAYLVDKSIEEVIFHKDYDKITIATNK